MKVHLLFSPQLHGALRRPRRKRLSIAQENIGEITHGVPGTGSLGMVISGALETSNVDLAGEFSEMIITQRGFQANSRIITVSDTLLEELINLKR